MKITYAILKEYCSVALEPKKLADLLTLHGVKVESIEGQGDNTVFEFEITANRPDCLSFIGIARETALITGVKAKQGSKSQITNLKSKIGSASFIQIKEPKLCPMYIGRIIRDVKVGPSPAWLKSNLESLGLRSINNIVDITNWVLLETGQPLHAFDLDKLKGQEIIVRTAAQGATPIGGEPRQGRENLVAIDAKTYALTPEMLVIADSQKPVALAGIMGGKDTEVTESTRNILLESAYFNPACIRRTSRQLVLQTDSSYRFERIVDPKGVEAASQRAVGLILEMAGGTLTGYQTLDYLKYKDRKVTLRTERISRMLGITIPVPEIKRILTGLGLTIKKSSAKGFELVAPSFRPDINIEADIIEELARIRGYDKIPVTPPRIELKVAQPDKIYDVTRTARSHLVESGYNEALTNSFWDVEEIKRTTLGVYTEPFGNPQDKLRECAQRTTLIGLSAPDGTTDRFMRNNLVKGLLDVFNLNENYLHSEVQKTIKLFEISKTYHKAGDTTKEWFALGIVDNAGFYSLKGTIEGLFIVLGLTGEYSPLIKGDKGGCNNPPAPFSKGELDGIVSYGNNELASMAIPKGIQNIVGINLDNNPIGYLGVLNKAPSDVYRSGREHAPIGAAHREADTSIGVGEINFEMLISRAVLTKQYKSFIRLPAVTRDIAVVVTESITWAEIETISRQALTGSAQDIPLEKIEFFDIYRGKQVPAGHKSIAFSLTFRHPTRTLASEVVDSVVKTVVDALANDLKATLRA